MKAKRNLLVAITLLISIFVTFLVSAERYGCCFKTVTGRYCTETYESLCERGQFLGGSCTDQRNSDKCGLVTCALPYDCMFNVPKGKCLYEHKGTIALGDECKKECCGIAGRAYGILTHKACRLLAFKKGFNESFIEFFDTQNEFECYAHFASTEKGCCITPEGCKDTTRQECKGTFHAGVLCREIPERCQVKVIGKRCGKQPGNENKIVIVDSAGGEKPIFSCSVPQYVCLECNKEKCHDDERNIDVGRFEAYCKDTSCKLPKLYHQKVNEDGKIEKVPIISTILQTGQSICYNFYGVSSERDGLEKSDKMYIEKEDVLYMHGRSTGLQNHKLVCNYGNIIVVALGTDRKKLCKDDPNTYVARVIDNVENPEVCTNCGKLDNRILNPIGDYLSVGALSGSLLGNIVSEQCNEEKCKKIKNAQGESVCFFSRDLSFDIPGSNPIGSCVPKYPLGTTDYCTACGGGGDWLWNICKEQECYALGNCQFKHTSEVRGTFYFVLATLGFYGAHRIGLAPAYAVISCIKAGNPAAILTCIPTKIAKEVKEAVVGPVSLFTEVVGKISGEGKNIVETIKKTLIDEIIGEIISAIKNAIGL